MDPQLEWRAHQASLAVRFASFDRDFEQERFGRCLEAIACVEGVVGVDPYLDLLRANVHLQDGQARQSLECARRGCAGLPHIEQAWIMLGSAAVAARENAALLEALEQLVTRFDQDPQEAEDGYDLAAFRESPEGARWEEWKRAREGPPR